MTNIENLLFSERATSVAPDTRNTIIGALMKFGFEWVLMFLLEDGGSIVGVCRQFLSMLLPLYPRRKEPNPDPASGLGGTPLNSSGLQKLNDSPSSGAWFSFM